MKTVSILIALGLFCATQALALNASSITYAIEPIIGYERVQKFKPTPHSNDRMIYGARASVGVPYLSGEAQLTRGTDTESFPLEDLSIKDTDDKLKVGLRSSYQMGSLLSLTGRGGVQGKRNTHEENRAGTTNKTVSKIQYDPYAGAAFGFRLSNKIEVSAGITAVFNDFPHMQKNDYETTLGMRIKFP